jgi:hypothetical protein
MITIKKKSSGSAIFDAIQYECWLRENAGTDSLWNVLINGHTLIISIPEEEDAVAFKIRFG